MINRFRGETSHHRLIWALRKQLILHDNETLANEIADQGELLQFESNEEIVVQGDADNDIYFILAGRLSIFVNGREVAIRNSGQHVGEMVLIDPSARRAASVVAIEQTVVMKISETSFRSLAEKYPRVWQLIAIELADRLRQRNRLVAAKNPRPVMFIGSSKESLPIAEAIKSNLEDKDLIVQLWTDGVFSASQFILSELERQVNESDFAVLVLGADDVVESRDEISDAPRDNVIFELGLFMGALSHERTFMVIPRDYDIKIPTDLLGLIPLKYESNDSNNLATLLIPICDQLQHTINKAGVK
ncbi:MAG: nucleotide-binding protein [Candidatus Poribacteria bacterium]|nr:nucleotide-binding protein [Candidatus Poribacteria bacterium]